MNTFGDEMNYKLERIGNNNLHHHLVPISFDIHFMCERGGNE